MADDLITELTTLRDRLADALDGYTQATRSVDDTELRALFARAATDKARSISELAHFLPADAADDAGTIVGPITKGIVYVRSALTGDASLLPGMIAGEERVNEACAEAFAAAAGTPDAVAVVTEIGRRQTALLAELEAARTRLAADA